MKYIQYFILLLCSLAFYNCNDSHIRVACIGDSITYGHGIKDRAKTYPAVLGQLLGEQYNVRNFGVNFATNLRKGDSPYINQQAYKDAINFNPDIVIIKLGTNDSKAYIWDKYKDDFDRDLAALIEILQSLPAQPKVYLCLPAKCHTTDSSIQDEVIRTEITPLIKEVANKFDCEIIDIYDATSRMPQNFFDSIHPDENGTKVIAETIYEKIKSTYTYK